MTKPEQPQDMSKEKTFEERFDEKFTQRYWVGGDVNAEAFDGEMVDDIKAFTRQEILKVIDSFEMEERDMTSENSPDIYGNARVKAYNIAVRETNSRVKELRKEYE